MDELGPFYTRSSFWRRFITIGLFVLFILAFWRDIGPDLRGWWNLLVIFAQTVAPRLVHPRAVQFDSATLTAMLKVTSNMVVYLIVYFISLFVVAQFTLPVQSWKERRSAFGRLFLFLLHWQGPIVVIREGKIVVNKISDNDDDIAYPGVALVDLSSAIVLEHLPWRKGVDDAQEITQPKKLKPSFLNRKIPQARQENESNWLRVCGPGVNFTNYGESIHAVVDLRRQVRIDPGIKALTRDGIEVETPVFSVFSISDPPDVIPVAYVGGTKKENLYALDIEGKDNNFVVKGKFELDTVDADEIHSFVVSGHVQAEGLVVQQPPSGNVKTQYHYDADRVFMAACAEAAHVSPEEKNMLWHQLPQYIAIETFQNLLAQYTYDYINSPVSEGKVAVDSDTKETPTSIEEPFFKKLKKEFNQKVRYHGILSYQLVRLSKPIQNVDKRTLKWNESALGEEDFNIIRPASELEMSAAYPLSASKVLRDRGIKIVVVGFPEIKSPPEIRAQIAESWKARLESQIKITQAKHEREAMQVINSARTQMQRESTYFLSNIFKNEPHSQEALALLLFQSLENAATDPNSYKDIPPKEILVMLQNLHRWLLIERKEAERNKNKEAERNKNKEDHKKGDNQEHQSPPSKESI